MEDQLVQGFEALRPETSVNWKRSEGPNDPIRLSDEILTFIGDKEIESGVKVLLELPYF